MNNGRFARLVYMFAGIYGLLVVAPQYFMERQIEQDYPPAITHPEYFYGFIGVALAWQVAFLIIAADPARYRLMMWPSMLEKLSFGTATAILFAQSRAPALVMGFAAIDLLWAALFAAALVKTPRR